MARKRANARARTKRRSQKFKKNQFENTESFMVTKRLDSILLNRESLSDTNILKKNIGLLKDANIWHAFILKKVSTMTKKYLLKTVMDFLMPVGIIPVHFKCIGDDRLFLSFSCAEAVYKLWNNNLEVPNPLNTAFPIQCDIILSYSSLKLISFNAVKTNYLFYLKKLMMNGEELDLESLADREMPEYWPLSKPKILQMVLEISKKLRPTCIKLNNNAIGSLLPLVVLWDTNITRLDLRNNLITSVSQLEVLKMMNLLELSLDGNPLCNEFGDDEQMYVKRLKDIFPNLLKLDGIRVDNDVGPVFQRNFLCDSFGFDLVNQFLEFYFPLYDSYRDRLVNVYHKNATFSITSSYMSNQDTLDTAELVHYMVNNRNLINLSDFRKQRDSLIRGAPSIVKKLLEWPESEHDPNSFTVDLIYHKGNLSVIFITGVFQELHNKGFQKNYCLLGFSRTFSLIGSNGEYTIINDLMHVYNALTPHVQRPFKVEKPPTATFIALTDSDKVRAIEAIQLTTGIKKEWAERLFIESKSDLVKCLQTFMANVKVDKIPLYAYENEFKRNR